MPREVKGILWIGDPHLSSRKPGRRKDADFAGTVIGKLEQAIDLANENRWLVAILGDLFDRSREEDETVKTRLLRVLRKAWTTPVALVGNHDVRNAMLSDGDTLAVIAASGALMVHEVSGPIEELEIDGVRVGLGGTPHGQDIPRSVYGDFPEADMTVWMTHHDMAFEGAYPGAIECFEIAGCALVVNGHMHLSKPEIHAGGTIWCNPGNVTRWSVDAAGHKPSVWSWTPSGGMTRHELRHERDAFDLTGYLVEAQSPAAGAAAQGQPSVFVEMMKVEAAADMARSDDGSMLREEIERLFAQDEVPQEVRALVMDLHAQACAANMAKAA